MFTIDRILHPTDFSPGAKAAFAHAIQMARKHGATLHVLNAAPNPDEPPIRFSHGLDMNEETIYKKVEDKAQELIDEFVAEADIEDLDVVRAHERGLAPGPVIVKYAERHDVDLIVMGTHGRRGMRRFVLGSVAEEVVRKASCSVLTVRGAEETITERPTIRRILVPVDLSEFTIPLIRAAHDVAATYGARVDLLHVVEPLPFPVPLLGGLTLNDLVADPTGQARAQLEHLVEKEKKTDVSFEVHVEEGRAAPVIVEQAEALGSDLVMIASHGLSGLEGFLLGSVAARVVRRAACPVLVARVKPEEAPEGPISSETSSAA